MTAAPGAKNFRHPTLVKLLQDDRNGSEGLGSVGQLAEEEVGHSGADGQMLEGSYLPRECQYFNGQPTVSEVWHRRGAGWWVCQFI